MSDLSARIAELEAKERRLDTILAKVEGVVPSAEDVAREFDEIHGDGIGLNEIETLVTAERFREAARHEVLRMALGEAAPLLAAYRRLMLDAYPHIGQDKSVPGHYPSHIARCSALIRHIEDFNAPTGQAALRPEGSSNGR